MNTIYKMVLRSGMDTELYPRIYCKFDKAVKEAYQMIEIEEDIDTIVIYTEIPDEELGFYRTFGKGYRIQREKQPED